MALCHGEDVLLFLWLYRYPGVQLQWYLLKMEVATHVTFPFYIVGRHHLG